ncbi:MAG: type 4a pilus biogenesis protein PilO [Gemmatimonadetes bacterium]|nr:type 4a pilus biogenesis protein PilO [Gemmatimonadota bacterium]
MALLPERSQDQAKVLVGVVAFAIAAWYYLYPYAEADAQLAIDQERVTALTALNDSAARDFTPGAIRRLRERSAEHRAMLGVMRRLVPSSNEVPALLEEVSNAARRAGLDVGGVVPEPVLPGEHFDTYRYTVTIAGSYHQVGEFLANVGSLPRIVAPVHLAIVPAVGSANAPDGRARAEGARGRGVLTATVLLQTYVERTAVEGAPPAGATPGNGMSQGGTP